MAVVRVLRKIGGRDVEFVVNLTTHPSNRLQIPEALKNRQFDVVVDECLTANPEMQKIQEREEGLKALEYRLPEYELARGLMPQFKSEERLDAYLRKHLTPDEYVDFRIASMFYTGDAIFVSATPSLTYGALRIEGWHSELHKQESAAAARASKARNVLQYSGLTTAALLFPPLMTYAKGKREAMDRRKFGRNLLALALLAGAHGTGALALLSGAYGINKVHPLRSMPQRLTGQRKVSERDIEFLKARVADALFPSLVVAGRSAIIADAAVESANKIVKEEAMLRSVLAGGEMPQQPYQVVRAVIATKEPNREIKILINIGAAHADVVNFLKNDRLRQKKKAWYVDGFQKMADLSLRQALKEHAKMLEGEGFPMGELRAIGRKYLEKRKELERAHAGEESTRRGTRARPGEEYGRAEEYEEYLDVILRLRKRQTMRPAPPRYARREFFQKFLPKGSKPTTRRA